MNKRGNKVRSRVLCILVLVFLMVGPGLSEDKPEESPQKAVKTMIDYKDELGLSETQVSEVREALLSFQKTVKEQRQALAQQEKEYKELVQKEAPLSDIKSKLRQISDTRFNLRYADVLTSRRVSEALSSEQMEKWRAIQSKVRARK